MPCNRNEFSSLNSRHSLSVIATSSQRVIGLVSLGSFGSHKNGVAAKVGANVTVRCRVIAQELVALVSAR
jgi:hypothetical protein